jgi:hypothetical protein
MGIRYQYHLLASFVSAADVCKLERRWQFTTRSIASVSALAFDQFEHARPRPWSANLEQFRTVSSSLIVILYRQPQGTAPCAYLLWQFEPGGMGALRLVEKCAFNLDENENSRASNYLQDEMELVTCSNKQH